jgi:hypothetical protein
MHRRQKISGIPTRHISVPGDRPCGAIIISELLHSSECEISDYEIPIYLINRAEISQMRNSKMAGAR